jgi:hypothetical protein
MDMAVDIAQTKQAVAVLRDLELVPADFTVDQLWADNSIISKLVH